jgi:hypothetical protein
MSDLSLMTIIRDDPDFGRRIAKKVQEIKQDKQNLLDVADQYGQRYQEEILKGTELRAKLLTEGSSRGLSEEEVMSQYGRFVPTVYTPILNLLYFLLRESEVQDQDLYRQRDKLNEQFGHLQEEDVKSTVLKDPPEMVEFLYGNITLDMFNKIKKLKALSKSPNEKEAFRAYRKAQELCKQYNLDFDRIPCYVKGQDE